MSTQTPDSQGVSAPGNSAGMFNRDYNILVAWVVLITVILLIKSTKFGYTLIYYALLLLLVFLIVTQYQFFDWALAPFRQLGAGFTFGAQDTNEPSSKGQSESGVNQ